MTTGESPFTEALRNLPHGKEFRFVDRLTQLEPGKAGAGEYRIRGDEAFLRGHFPDAPLMPGVLIIEAVAQLAGVVAQCDPEHPPLPGLKLTAVRGAKIFGTGRPGDVIQLQVEITGRLANLIQARGSATVNGQVVLQTDVVLSGTGAT